MYKYKVLLIFFLFFFVFNFNVYAFSGDYNYNYEVTNLERDNSSNKITIEGWGILNAGVGDGKSPPVVKELGSGSGNNCTGDTSNKYTYVLEAVPIINNKLNHGKKVLLGRIDGGNRSIDLTKVMCQRGSGNNCIKNKSSCYKNVGWSFTFSDTHLNEFKDGYVFYLTIISSNHGKIKLDNGRSSSESFPLAIYSNRIKNMNAKYYNTTNNNTLSDFKVKVIVYGGRYQKTYKINGSYGSDKKFQEGKEYIVQEVKYNNSTGFAKGTYSYKLDAWSKPTWAPASWIAPIKHMATLITPNITEPDKPETCNPKQPVVENPVDIELKSCSVKTNLTKDYKLDSCDVDSPDYYTLTCSEFDFETNLVINELPEKTTTFDLTKGGGFPVDVKISTNLKCIYEFNTKDFQTDYNTYVNGIRSSESTISSLQSEINHLNSLISAESAKKEPNREVISSYQKSITSAENAQKNAYKYIKTARNALASLEKVLNYYNNITSFDINNWDSGYKFENITANLNVNDITDELVLKTDTLKHEKIDLNNDKQKDDMWCTSKTDTIKLESGNKQVKSLTCGEHWEKELIYKEVCLSAKTGDVEFCLNNGTQLNGGNKYYIPMNSTNGDISIDILEAGYNQNWNIYLSDCTYNAPEKIEIIYRSIDLTDPFLQSYTSNGNKREIGKNFKNDIYDFTGIIQSNLWNQERYYFKYDLSKTNVFNIRKDTTDDVNKYLGTTCYFTPDNTKPSNYHCDFIKDGNFFTNIYQYKAN